MFIHKLHCSFISTLLTAVLTTLSVSQEQSTLTLSGFGFWVQEVPDSGQATLKLKHVWLIADKQLGDSLELKTFLAFQGPPRIVHTLFLKWRNPLSFIEYARVGKFEPPFGHGTNFYRIDRNPTIYYSVVDAPVVARAHGAEAAIRWQGFGLKLAAMSGERLLGNFPTTYENHWDVYARPTYKLTQDITCGVSTRFGPVEAWSADVQIEVGLLHLELEGISSRDTTNYTTLITYQVSPWFRPILRYECVLKQNWWTPGFSIRLPVDAEFKCNLVYTSGKVQTALGQLVIRW